MSGIQLGTEQATLLLISIFLEPTIKNHAGKTTWHVPLNSRHVACKSRAPTHDIIYSFLSGFRSTDQVPLAVPNRHSRSCHVEVTVGIVTVIWLPRLAMGHVTCVVEQSGRWFFILRYGPPNLEKKKILKVKKKRSLGKQNIRMLFSVFLTLKRVNYVMLWHRSPSKEACFVDYHDSRGITYNALTMRNCTFYPLIIIIIISRVEEDRDESGFSGISWDGVGIKEQKKKT